MGRKFIPVSVNQEASKVYILDTKKIYKFKKKKTPKIPLFEQKLDQKR